MRVWFEGGGVLDGFEFDLPDGTETRMLRVVLQTCPEGESDPFTLPLSTYEHDCDGHYVARPT